MPKRSRWGARHPASTHVLAENLGDMLLLFRGLNMAFYKGAPLPPEVMDLIETFVVGPLQLVRAGHSYLYNTNGTVNPKWLLRFMTIERKEFDIAYGAAYHKKRAKHHVCMSLGCKCNAMPWTTPHPEWTRKQWNRFLHERFENCITRGYNSDYGPVIKRNIYDHATRFHVAGLGFSYRHQIMLYEPYANESEAVITEQLRDILGANFERFVRVRSVPGGLQIFFFGPAVDIDAVMESNLFSKHSYFTGDTALHSWPTPGCEYWYGPYLLHGKGGRRQLSIGFK